MEGTVSEERTVYLAGAWSRREELAEYAKDLMFHGFYVCSRWLWSNNRGLTDTEAAQRDLDDLGRADALILFTEDPPLGKGGASVELGWALARGLPVYRVGPQTNVFTTVVLASFESWRSVRWKWADHTSPFWDVWMKDRHR